MDVKPTKEELAIFKTSEFSEAMKFDTLSLFSVYPQISPLKILNRSAKRRELFRVITNNTNMITDDYEETVLSLVKNGYNINYKKNRTALECVAWYTCDVKTGKFLISVGAEVTKDVARNASLCVPTSKGIKFLDFLGKVSDLDYDDIFVWLFEEEQIENYIVSFEIIDYLIGKGADVNSLTSEGYSALYSIVKYTNHDCLETISLLIEKGADLDIDFKGDKPLGLAIQLNKERYILKLATADNVNKPHSIGGWNMLPIVEYCKRNCSLQVLKHFVEMGADLNAKSNGMTCLMHLLKNNQGGELDKICFVAQNCDVNIQNDEGKTAAMLLPFGSEVDYTSLFRMLMLVGYDKSLVDNEGSTLLDIIIKRCNRTVLEDYCINSEVVNNIRFLLGNDFPFDISPNLVKPGLYFVCEMREIIMDDEDDYEEEDNESLISVLDMMVEKGADINQLYRGKRLVEHFPHILSKYKKNNQNCKVNIKNIMCCVCHDENEDVEALSVFSCGHVNVCPGCYKSLQTNKCPTCRKEFTWITDITLVR